MNKVENMINPALVKTRFNRASQTYDEFAEIAHEVGRRLIERLDYIKLKPKRVIDVGCGTGQFTTLLKKRYKKSQVMGFDFAFKMIKQAKKKAGWFNKTEFVHADAYHLPLDSRSVDIVFSNLLMPWCDDLPRLLAEFRRVLKPDGLLMFSTFGPDTLIQIRQAWGALDEKPHLPVFFDMHDVGDQLLQAQFADPVVDSDFIQVHYDDHEKCFHELKQSGFTSVMRDSPKHLLTPARLVQLKKQFEPCLTYEIIFGNAWGSELLNLKDRDDPSVRYFPIDQLKRNSKIP